MRGIGGRVLWVPQNLPSTSTSRHTGDCLVQVVARVEDCNRLLKIELPCQIVAY